MNRIFKPVKYLLIWLVCAYGLVLALYLINRPFIAPERYAKENPAHMLNQLMPRESDYKYLIEMVDKNIRPSRRALKHCLEYFTRVIKVSENRPDAWALSGFCYYHLGETKKAIQSYQKAIEINPAFFWYYYNLGVIYHNQGEYQASHVLLSKALSLDFSLVPRFVLLSPRHYLQIARAKGENFQEEIMRDIREAVAKAKELILWNQQNLNRKTPPLVPAPIELY